MEQSELLKHLVKAFEALGIRYFLTGSIASIFYGEPRFTNDIDVVAEIKEEHIGGLLNLFPPGEFYADEEAMREAIAWNRQFNIIHPGSGLKIDVIVCGKEPFNEGRFNRAGRLPAAEDLLANFASPEDVIIMKLRYYKEGGSEKHLRDIAGMVKISGGIIDREYIVKWAGEFGLNAIWNAVLERLKAGGVR